MVVIRKSFVAVAALVAGLMVSDLSAVGATRNKIFAAPTAVVPAAGNSFKAKVLAFAKNVAQSPIALDTAKAGFAVLILAIAASLPGYLLSPESQIAALFPEDDGFICRTIPCAFVAIVALVGGFAACSAASLSS